MLSRLTLMLAALTLSVPALAQSEADTLRAVRTFADATSGQPADGDKLLTFARQGGTLAVTGMAVSPANQWTPPAQGTYAVMRTISSAPSNNSMPPATALDFVRQNRVRLFLVGEWSTPPTVWEIAVHQGDVRFRQIGADSRPGTWLSPTGQPGGAAH